MLQTSLRPPMVLVVISMSAAFFSIRRIRYCERTNLNISLTGMALISPVKCSTVAVPLLAHLSPRRRGIIISASLSPSTEVDWVKETSSFFEKDPRPIMLFDGVCNLCNGGVKFVRDNDRKRPMANTWVVDFAFAGNGSMIEFSKIDFLKPCLSRQFHETTRIRLNLPINFKNDMLAITYRGASAALYDYLLKKVVSWNIRFEALQSEAGKKLLQRSGRAPDDISSVVLVDKDRSYIKSEAVLKIMQYINLPFPQLALFLQFIPLFIRDFVYDNVADNRYSFFGRSDSCDL